MSGKLGELFECRDCGVVQIRTLINQTRCEDCRNGERTKYQYEKNKEYRQSNFAKIPDAPQMPKPKYTLSEVCAAAKVHNMTYGKYVASLKNGNVEPPERLPEKKKRGRKKKNESG